MRYFGIMVILLVTSGCVSTQTKEAEKNQTQKESSGFIVSKLKSDELSEIKRLSALFPSLFSKEAGFTLSYSESSIKYLDAFVSQQWVIDSNRDTMINLVGSFLGEAAINNYGGEWVKVNGEKAVKVDDGFVTFPYGKVNRSLSGETNESIYQYFTSIAQGRKKT